MDLGLDGKTAIVTGGSKGIGRAVALSLVGEDARACWSAHAGKQALGENRSRRV